jgi:hypothetical protein
LVGRVFGLAVAISCIAQGAHAAEADDEAAARKICSAFGSKYANGPYGGAFASTSGKFKIKGEADGSAVLFADGVPVAEVSNLNYKNYAVRQYDP